MSMSVTRSGELRTSGRAKLTRCIMSLQARLARKTAVSEQPIHTMASEKLVKYSAALCGESSSMIVTVLLISGR